jgi:hypothetical protein
MVIRLGHAARTGFKQIEHLLNRRPQLLLDLGGSERVAPGKRIVDQGFKGWHGNSLLVMYSAAPGRVTSCQGYLFRAATFTWRRCPIALHARRQFATKARTTRQVQHAIEASLRYRTSATRLATQSVTATLNPPFRHSSR